MNQASQTSADRRMHWFTESSLAHSFQPGECLICSNLIHSERLAVHSFLYEGMMSSAARERFLEKQGFCLRHFWIAKEIEEKCWPGGGIAVAILCENLIAKAIDELPEELGLKCSKRLPRFHRRRNSNAARYSSDLCMFCTNNVEKEKSLITVIEDLKKASNWSEKLEQAPFCLHHGLMALDLWIQESNKVEVRNQMKARLQDLRSDLDNFLRKHDWNYRHEPLGREKDAVFRAIRMLSGLERQFPQQKANTDGGKLNGAGKR